MNATIAPATLDTWDYVTLTVMVALTTVVGFYHVFKVKKTSNTKEFLVSGKGIGFFPVALSTVATAISPTSMQGYPLEIYMSGIQFVFLSASQFIGIGLFAVLYLPVYYNLGFSSIFQVRSQWLLKGMQFLRMDLFKFKAPANCIWCAGICTCTEVDFGTKISSGQLL